MELREPFETSFGIERYRNFLLVEAVDRTGLSGWGECVAAGDPLYSEEAVATARWMIGERLVPLLGSPAGTTILRYRTLAERFRGHRMAKAAVESALLDLAARRARLPLHRLLGNARRGRVPVGVSVGIQASPAALVDTVGRYLEQGYRRIKLKVDPGRDSAYVAAVRRTYPDVELWVDANQAYSPRALPQIRRWAERYDVAQVEQPFAERAIAAHAALQRGARFRVCLDESVTGRVSLEDALERRALKSLNVKAGRVGGALAGVALARRARRAGVSAWVGGMLESGIGRAHNLHLASLGAFDLSADLSASTRYYVRDLIEQPFQLNSDSTIDVPSGPGSGVSLDDRVHRRALRRRQRFALRATAAAAPPRRYSAGGGFSRR